MTKKPSDSPDLVVFGDPDSFQLLSELSSLTEDWSESTSAMVIPGFGCVVHVRVYKEKAASSSLTFVPGVTVQPIGGDPANGRELVPIGIGQY